MSDKQKGLLPACEIVLPTVKHRFCVRHLHCNMRVAGFTANPIKDGLWKAARACTVNNFRAALQELRNLDEGAFAWLVDKHPSEWSRSHFTRTAQLFESKTKAAEWSGVICPAIVRNIDDIEKQAGGLIGFQCGPMLFEIMGTFSGQYSVDLGSRLCSCRKWDLTGIPCSHAVCAIWIKHGKGPVWHYVDPSYYISTYLKTYDGCIKPMAGFEKWPAIEREPPLPPLYNAKPGRPRKLRKRSAGETRPAGESSKASVYLTRKHVTLHCTICKQSGHNSRKCPQKPTVRPPNQVS
ncbi:uncharacterized protein LOC116023484 [Ipomoea triloba]|uniref:uncharacterized protein LOC116023484 n=1 Tax=Ipomoea triloba TaxID=35885 RepID=UPI00125D89C6|nr:uncharacterized protein LOC116023484 [Ipomoea triloba]